MTDPTEPTFEAPETTRHGDRIEIRQTTDEWYDQCLDLTVEQARNLADSIYRLLVERQ